MLSPELEDYLKTVYQLERGSGERVATSDVAEALGVEPPTVVKMLEKLEDRGLVDREKYSGARVTEEGETVALEIVRHHRLLEAYLTQELDFSWSEVHDEADRLEHHISEELEEQVAAALGDPERDPHGAPIPNERLEPPEEVEGTPLDGCCEGDSVEVDRVEDEDGEVLEYLQSHGVVPGVRIEVVEVAPFGMVTVQTEEGRVSLPEEVAREVRVAPSAEAD